MAGNDQKSNKKDIEEKAKVNKRCRQAKRTTERAGGEGGRTAWETFAKYAAAEAEAAAEADARSKSAKQIALSLSLILCLALCST